jgi:divalent metal cation (Fe/Co/Zn/Cd) transporter
MPSREMIEGVRTAAPDVAGVDVDKSYARKTGFKYHVDLHIEVDPSLTVAASNVIGGRVRTQVGDQVGWVPDVLVHVEPLRRAIPTVSSVPESGTLNDR